MFDLGMMELLVIGIVALIVVGPKDLPGMFRTVGNFVGKAKSMAREFQRSMDAVVDESGIKDAGKDFNDMAKSVDSATNFKASDFNADLDGDDITIPPKPRSKKPSSSKPKSKSTSKSDSGSKSKSKPATKTASKSAAKPAAKAAKKPVAAAKNVKAASKPASAKSKKPAVSKTATKKASAKKPAAKKPAVKKQAAVKE